MAGLTCVCVCVCVSVSVWEFCGERLSNYRHYSSPQLPMCTGAKAVP
jgi:hypothetical protein